MQNKFSYWENNTYFNNINLTVVGAGIVGLNAAISHKKNNPKHKVLVVDQGLMPNGASTKNAGFACFGSPSELLDDLQESTENEVFSLVERRYKGLLNLRSLLGDSKLDYQNNYGFELFTESTNPLFEECKDQLPYLNKQLSLIVGEDTYSSNTKVKLTLGK
jgi:hypothetical protein